MPEIFHVKLPCEKGWDLVCLGGREGGRGMVDMYIHYLLGKGEKEEKIKRKRGKKAYNSSTLY